MAMDWQKVTQVLDNMYSNKELAEKIGNENAHEDYMLIKETSMAVGEEAKNVFDKELEEEKGIIFSSATVIRRFSEKQSSS